MAGRENIAPSGDGGMTGALRTAAWLPVTLYKRLVYDTRPDLNNRKTGPEEWRQLQSESRFIAGLLCYLGPPCFVLWRIKWPLLLNTTIGVVVTIDQTLDYYRPHLSLLPDLDVFVNTSWRMTSFVMALLLAFRVNRTYERWWQARSAFAGLGNAGVALSQQAMSCIANPAIRDEVRRWSKIWQYALEQACSFAKAIHSDGAALMGPEELALYNTAPTDIICGNLRLLLARAGLSTEERGMMEDTLAAGMSHGYVCTRIVTTAMPLGLSLMCTGFLQVFLMFMPWGLVRATSGSSSNNPHARDPPVFGLVYYIFSCILLLGVDEVATQLEQPFPSMPMRALVKGACDRIDRVQEAHAKVAALQDQVLQLHDKRLPHSCSSLLNGGDAITVCTGT